MMDLEERTFDITYPGQGNGKRGFDLIVAADVLVYFVFWQCFKSAENICSNFQQGCKTVVYYRTDK
jgi:hypothetical protein